MLSKPVSADQEFTPAIYKNRDPISVCAKLRVEEGGSIVGRVQSKEANPQFFFTLALTGSGAPVFLSVGAHLISRSSCSSTREKWSAAMIFISPVPTSTTSVPGWSGAAKMATWAARLQGHGLPVDLRCWASPHESGDSPKPLDAV